MAMVDLLLVERTWLGVVGVGPRIDLNPLASSTVELIVRNFVGVTWEIEGLTSRGACAATSMWTMLV